MAFSIRYQPPAGEEALDLDHVDSVVIGRAPGSDGVCLVPFDETISAAAAEVSQIEGGLRIENTSTYASIEVQLDHGSRWLSPGEATTTPRSSTVVIAGEVYRHVVRLTPSESPPVAVPATGTRPVLSTNYEVAPERFPSLVALCASRFYPDRFGTDLLSAREIAKKVSANSDQPTTQRAVHNKLQRLREDVESRFGVPMESREDLADWAIRNAVVTRRDVDSLLDN